MLPATSTGKGHVRFNNSKENQCWRKHLALCLLTDCFSLLPVWIAHWYPDQQPGWMCICFVCMCVFVCVPSANSLARMCGGACWILIWCLLFNTIFRMSEWIDVTGAEYIVVCWYTVCYRMYWHVQVKVLWWFYSIGCSSCQILIRELGQNM